MDSEQIELYNFMPQLVAGRVNGLSLIVAQQDENDSSICANSIGQRYIIFVWTGNLPRTRHRILAVAIVYALSYGERTKLLQIPWDEQNKSGECTTTTELR